MTLSKDLTEALLQTQEKLLAALAEVERLRDVLATIGAMSPEMAESDAAAGARDALR